MIDMLSFKPVLFWQTIAVIVYAALSSNCVRIDDKEKPKTVHVNTIINQVCETRDTVSFTLNDYEITLPCDASKEFAVSPTLDHNIDYSQQSYVEGVLPLPIRVLHFRLMDPEIYHPMWENPPPTGVILNLHIPVNSKSSQDRKPSQKCDYYSTKEVWCNHLILISDTDVVAQLEFNGGPTHALSALNIIPERRPWAYYSEESWPQLYERTELFVKSLIK